MIQSGASRWNFYNNKLNRRHEGMSQFWIRPLTWGLENLGMLGPNARVLDYGCGYFDLGFALIDRVKLVHGYDINPVSVQTAIERLNESQKPSSLLTADFERLPLNTYDVIVLNSVAQYLGDLNAFETLLVKLSTLLDRSGLGCIVISDLIPSKYHKLWDGLYCLLYASFHGYMLPMFTHLSKAARSTDDFKLLQVGVDDLNAIATRHGFVLEKLQKNLTPSPFRYTCVLRKLR